MSNEFQCILTHRYFFCFVKDQVDEGVPLNICLSQFLKWIQKIQREKKITFSSGIPSHSTSEAKLCTFVTWTGKYNFTLLFLQNNTHENQTFGGASEIVYSLLGSQNPVTGY